MAAGLGLLASVGGAMAQAPTPTPTPTPTPAIERAPGDLPGPIDSLQDIQDTSRMLFQAADSDHDGQLSRAEFDKVLVGPANTLFAVIDANGDGKISEREAQAARQFLRRDRAS